MAGRRVCLGLCVWVCVHGCPYEWECKEPGVRRGNTALLRVPQWLERSPSDIEFVTQETEVAPIVEDLSEYRTRRRSRRR